MTGPVKPQFTTKKYEVKSSYRVAKGRRTRKVFRRRAEYHEASKKNKKKKKQYIENSARSSFSQAPSSCFCRFSLSLSTASTRPVSASSDNIIVDM